MLKIHPRFIYRYYILIQNREMFLELLKYFVVMIGYHLQTMTLYKPTFLHVNSVNYLIFLLEVLKILLLISMLLMQAKNTLSSDLLIYLQNIFNANPLNFGR